MNYCSTATVFTVNTVYIQLEKVLYVKRQTECKLNEQISAPSDNMVSRIDKLAASSPSPPQPPNTILKSQ